MVSESEQQGQGVQNLPMQADGVLLEEIDTLLWKWDAGQENEIFGKPMSSRDLAAFLIERIAAAVYSQRASPLRADAQPPVTHC